jgi:hypothetical protein
VIDKLQIRPPIPVVVSPRRGTPIAICHPCDGHAREHTTPVLVSEGRSERSRLFWDSLRAGGTHLWAATLELERVGVPHHKSTTSWRRMPSNRGQQRTTRNGRIGLQNRWSGVRVPPALLQPPGHEPSPSLSHVLRGSCSTICNRAGTWVLPLTSCSTSATLDPRATRRRSQIDYGRRERLPG